MTLRHFQILRAAAETGSLAGAAARLYLTPSAVSHAVREMEERAGTALFDRLPKGVRLTPCGQRLLAEAAPILAACESLEARMGDLEAETPLHLVSSITIASFWLPGLLKRFSELCPRTPVEVEVISAGEALEVLRSGGADLALVEGPPPQGPFVSIPFASYRLVVVCAPRYRPKNGELTLRDLCGEKLLLRQKGSAIRDAFDSAVRLSGYTCRPAWTSINSTALLEAAKAGLGITILPELLVRGALGEGSLVELTVRDLALYNDLNAVRRRDRYETAPMAGFLRLIGREDPAYKRPSCLGPDLQKEGAAHVPESDGG